MVPVGFIVVETKMICTRHALQLYTTKQVFIPLEQSGNNRQVGKNWSIVEGDTVVSWIVYIIECRDGTLYTGVTNDLPRRLESHAKGIGAKYTRGRGPFRVRYTETHQTKGQALQREGHIKKLNTTCKRALTS